jgi:four helix bundle protein
VGTIKTFQELECWREARILVNTVYELTRRKDFSRDFELKNQLRRSAISVMANIAEGFHRVSGREFMKFLDYSRSSLAETLSHCYIALDQAYISASDLETVESRSDSVGRKVNALIAYLDKHNQ